MTVLGSGVHSVLRIRENTFKSLIRSSSAVSSVSGKLYGTSEQPSVWQRWPYPTVGRPMGSGDGDGTKPSYCLIRLTVAALTSGPVHALCVSGCATVKPKTRNGNRALRVEGYMAGCGCPLNLLRDHRSSIEGLQSIYMRAEQVETGSYSY